MKTLVSFLKDEKGLETVEWAILAALIIVGVIVAVGTLGPKVEAAFQELDNEMPDVSAG